MNKSQELLREEKFNKFVLTGLESGLKYSLTLLEKTFKLLRKDDTYTDEIALNLSKIKKETDDASKAIEGIMRMFKK